MGIWVLRSVDHTTLSAGQVPETWYKRKRPQHNGAGAQLRSERPLELADQNEGHPQHSTTDGSLRSVASGHSKHDNTMAGSGSGR